MKICLLAAGLGVRLGMKDQPKTLVELQGKPLLHYIIDSLEGLNPKELIVVGGYALNHLESSLKDYNRLPCQITFNKDFKLGSLYSIRCARDFLRGDDFLILNADHLFSGAIVDKIAQYIRTNPVNYTIVCDSDRALSDDDMKVSLQEGSFREMSKALSKYDCGYIGATFVPDLVQDLYWKILDGLIESGQNSLSVEQVINELARKNQKVEILNVSGSKWIEIDTKEDLAKAIDILPQVLSHKIM